MPSEVMQGRSIQPFGANDAIESDVADVAPRTRVLQNVRRLTFDEASDFPSGWTADSKNVLFHSLRAQNFYIYEQAYDKTVAQACGSPMHESRNV